jgi:thermitase
MSILFKARKAIFSVVLLLILVFVFIAGSRMTPTESNNKSATSRPDPSPSATLQPTVEPQIMRVPKDPIPDQVVIQFAPDATEAERTSYIQSLGGTVVNQIDALDTVVVTVSGEIAQEPLPESPAIAAAEPDYYVSALDLIPNDPSYSEQWALSAIGAPSAWEQMPADAPQVTVAVIDSGICASHLDLAGRILDGWDFIESDAVPQDDFGHGCSVSGVIAANMNDGLGIAGVAPNAQIMPLRVLNGSGVGSYSDVAAAIVYAADNGAKVINLSLGGSNPSSTLENAVNYAISKGTVVVAAAGNNGTEGALYPAAYPDVIAVGSVDPDLKHSSFSNYGSQIDIWAPGRNILTTKRDGSYGLVSGTSFAAPYVAGAEAIKYILNDALTISVNPLGLNIEYPITPTFSPADIATPTPTGTALPSSTSNGTDFDVYKDNEFGFSFLYPSNSTYVRWEPVLDILSTKSFFLDEWIDQAEIQPLPEVAITVFSNPNGLSLSDWKDAHTFGDEENIDATAAVFKNVGLPESLTIDGRPSLIFLHRIDGVLVARLLVEADHNVVSITMTHFDLGMMKNLFTTVASSFKFSVDGNLAVNQSLDQRLEEILGTLDVPEETSSVQEVSPLAYTGYKLPWPSGTSYYVSQNWGIPQPGVSHSGLGLYAYDFGMPGGSSVSASRTGKVVISDGGRADTTENCGGSDKANLANRIVINHSDGKASLYLHLMSTSVSADSSKDIPQGKIIGKSGRTGWTNCAYHLHFQVQNQGGWWEQSQEFYFDEYPATQLQWSNGSIKYTSQNQIATDVAPPQEQCSSYPFNGVTLFNDIECRGSEKKEIGSSGFTNLPDFNDKARSINIALGWSMRIWEHNDRGGASRCMDHDFWDLTKDWYDSGPQIYNSSGTISSVEVFHNSTCTATQGPGTPSLISPDNGQGIPNPQNVAFDWSATGDSYELIISSYGGAPSVGTFNTSTDSYNYGSMWPGIYQWKVKAWRNNLSVESETRTLYVPPGAPGSVTTTTNSTSAITINWTDSPGGVDQYQVLRNGSLIASVGGGTKSYQDTGRACGTSFTYSVKGIKSSLESAERSANGSTAACPVGPDTPILTNPSPSGTSITNPQSVTFDWSDSGSSYTFELTGGPSETTQNDLTSSQTSFGSLWAGVYQWRVTAWRNGTSAASGWWTLNVLPSAPASISVATNSTSAVTVNWGSSSGGVDGYRVYRNGSLITTLGSGSSSYQVTGLSCGDTSTYSVRGYIGSLESAATSTTGSTSACATGPSVPTLLSPGDGARIPNPQSVVFDWSASGDSYVIEITGGPSAGSPSVSTDLLNFGSMWPGIYQWRVKAYRNSQWSAWSNTWTLNVPPGAPGSVTVTTNSASAVTVNWTSSPGGVDGYKVYRNDSLVATVNGSTFNYPVTGLACGDTSTYSVVGYKGTLDSAARSTSGATAECLKTVRVVNSFITDENGTATSLEAGPNQLASGVQATTIKTDFNAGDAVQIHMEVENQYATNQTAYFEWIVFDPALQEIPELEWRGNLSTAPGTVDWYLTATIPAEVLTGDYTFIAAITFNGDLTYAYYDFHVMGIETVEVTKVYTTDEMGAAGLSTKLTSGKIEPSPLKPHRDVASNAITTTFKAGDPIQLYVEYYNNVSDGEIASYEWTVIDPWQRQVADLSYLDDLDNTLGDGWWRLNSNIPSNAITGTYTFTGSITYGGRTTKMTTTFYVNGAAGPSNDNFATPVVINSTPYYTSQNTWTATVASTDPTPTCGSGKNSNSVWYRYKAPANGLLETDTWGSDYDTVLAVWTGTINNLSLVDCNDDVGSDTAAWLEETPVVAGTTYYIEVLDYGNPGGGNLEFYANFAPSQSNNDFNTPITIDTLPYSVSQNTGGATQAYDDPALTACNRLPGKASVWYRYTPTVNANLVLDTKGSDYDTMLAVWTGSRGNLVSVGCNDDIGEVNGNWDQDSILFIPVRTGITYYIEASTYAGPIDINGASIDALQNKPDDLAATEATADGLQENKNNIEKNGGLITGLQDKRPDEISAQFWGGTLQLHVKPTYDITGNTGVFGATLYYVDDTPRTVVADGIGNYSITVPFGWSGVVTPYKTGYSFSPASRNYNNIQSSQVNQNYVAQSCVSCADVGITIGSTGVGDYSLPTSTAISNYYDRVAGGPVVVESMNGMNIFASEHRNYQTSFSESLGFPNDQLTTKYWFTRYAYNANVKTWILVTNTDPNQDADVKIYIGDLNNAHDSFTLPAGTAVSKYYDGLAGGPVVVESTNGVKIFASEHRNYQTSFSETLGFPDNQLTTKYWFTRYAYNANVKTWILVTNPDPDQDADVKIYIGGLTNAHDSFTLPAGTAVSKYYEGLAAGPVMVESTNGVKIFASEHRNYQTSFSETLGFPDNQLMTKYWFTRYAYNANVKTWILVTNPDPSQDADVKIYIGDLTNAIDTFSLPAGTALALPPYEGMAGGPVVVESTNGVEIFASEHRNYQTSFSESLGFPDDQLTTKYWFTRYAYNANVKTWVLVTNPQ